MSRHERSLTILLTPILSMILSAIAAGWVSAHEIRINEVLYDPVGADTGHEFVELYNAGPVAVDLNGWRLEAGNGAKPGDWRLQWEGGSQNVIDPGGFFLVAGGELEAEPDAWADLSLQNGPDAVRLLSPDGGADLVGWGALEYAEYYEGDPAADVSAGWALARVPDGVDTDSNAADFLARAYPTPGATNAPGWSLGLSGLQCDPPILDEDSGGELSLTLSNRGSKAVDLSTLSWDLAGAALDITEREIPTGVLEPDQLCDLSWHVSPLRSAVVETLRVAVLGPVGQRVEDEVIVRVGRGTVLISEILYDPAGDEGEWIELCNVSGVTVDLNGWSVADASGRATVFGPGSTALDPGGYLVVAEKPAGLRDAWPELTDGMVIERSGSWPSLNNTVDRERGYADQVLLLDSNGLPCDYVRYSPGDLDGDGVSLERWIEARRLVDPHVLVPCPSPGGGTPGTSSWTRGSRTEESRWLRPDPHPFFPDRQGDAQLCRIALPAPAGGSAAVTADVFSMAGRRVATLVAGARATGPLALVWDGRAASGAPLPTGLYLIRVVSRSDLDGDRRTALLPVALVRG